MNKNEYNCWCWSSNNKNNGSHCGCENKCCHEQEFSCKCKASGSSNCGSSQNSCENKYFNYGCGNNNSNQSSCGCENGYYSNSNYGYTSYNQENFGWY